jgi:hypothetical protein
VQIQKISNFINKNNKAQALLRKVSKNPAFFSVVSSFAISTTIRPISIMGMPMKDKDNKKYSIASSVAAGLTELIAAFMLFVPLNKHIEKTSKVLWGSPNTIFYDNNMLMRKYKSVNNRVVKILLMPIISLFRFALVAPLVKTIFKKDNK